MKKEKLELLHLVIGIAMLVVGLFLLTEKVTIDSALFSDNFVVAGTKLNPLLIVVPLAIGVVMMWFDSGALVSRIVSGLGLLLIVVCVVMTTTVTVPRISPLLWLLYFVLILGGFLLMVYSLFLGRDKGKKNDIVMETDVIEDEDAE